MAKNKKLNFAPSIFCLFIFSFLSVANGQNSYNDLSQEEKEQFEIATNERYQYLISRGVEEKLAMAAALFGVNDSVYNKWKMVSPNLEDLLEFKLLAFSVDEAIDWKKEGFTADTAKVWRKVNLEDLIGEWWYKIEIESEIVKIPPKIAKAYKKGGLDPYWAALWYATGHSSSDGIRQHNRWGQGCDGEAESMNRLYDSGGDEGRCYQIIAEVLQWVSNTEVIITIKDGRSSIPDAYYLSFPDGKAPENGFYGIVKRSGTATYKNMLGKTRKIPKFNVLAFIYGK